MTHSNTQFRNDINGLRAWAVIAVVLYHFNVAGLSAGFIGVDVFFVISGFLMTGIVAKALKKSAADFSLIDFFLARARRIIPALWLLCTALLALGWLLLPALEYQALAQQTQAAAGFYSNYFFWQGAGYFDASSQEKWLLHTWSLGVEWQFYILLPIVMAALWRYCSSRVIGYCLIAATLFSLLLACALTQIKPSFTFYSLATRAWEMLAGGLLYWYAHKLVFTDRQKYWLELIGFALIISSFIGFDTKTAWPSAATLLPVVGTCLVLIAARQNSVFTKSSVAQFFGNISYSLYLWHWPIAVALYFANLIDSWQWQLFGIGLSVGIALLSYHLVEQPARVKLSRYSNRTNILLLLTGFALLAGSCYWIVQHNGVNNRVAPRIDQILAERENKPANQQACLTRTPDQLISCTFGGEHLGVIVMGDSHASALIDNIQAALPNQDQHALLWAASSCPPILGVQHYTKKYGDVCGLIVQKAITSQQNLAADVPLILISRWSVYTEGTTEKDRKAEFGRASIFFDRNNPVALHAQYQQNLEETVCSISKQRPVYLMRPLPEMPDHIPNQKARALFIWQKDVSITLPLQAYYQRHAQVIAAQDHVAKQCGAHILDPLPYLCDAKQGFCFSEKDGLPIYSDDDHLSRRGGELLQPLLKSVFLK